MKVNTELSKEEKMMFSLLNTSLYRRFDETDCDILQNASDEEWTNCLKEAKNYGVLAMVCHAITQLPRPELMPSRGIKMQCIKRVYAAQNIHERYCQTIVKLQDIFKRHGIGMMVLKGVGISAYYPIPYLRRCGDIDIFAYSLDTSKMSHEEAIEKSDEVIRQLGIEVATHLYKHSCFKFNGIEVENHKYLLEVKLLDEAIEIDKYLRTITHPQKVTLYEKYNITIPSPEFNAIFIAFHASQHLGDVLSIYQLMDWTCVLNRHGMIIPERLKGTGFMKFVTSFTALSNQLLGTNIPVEHDEELDKVILNDILHSPFKGQIPPKNVFKWLLFKTRTNLHSIRTKQYVYNITVWKALKKTVISHWKQYL